MAWYLIDERGRRRVIEGEDEAILDIRRQMPEPTRVNCDQWTVPVCPCFSGKGTVSWTDEVGQIVGPFEAEYSVGVRIEFHKVLVRDGRGLAVWAWRCMRDDCIYF